MARLPNPNHLHTYPVGDVIEHELTPDCVCGPECVPIELDGGGFNWHYRHHSLDGRELREQEQS